VALVGDVRIDVSLTDVRRKSDLADYTGELQADQSLRLTDGLSGPGQDEPGTLSDTDFAFTVPCVATTSGNEGAICSLSTTANSITPGIVASGNRSVWQLGPIAVLDGGADGLASTQPNSIFMDQGLFVP
jgi:hypothetical protein